MASDKHMEAAWKLLDECEEDYRARANIIATALANAERDGCYDAADAILSEAKPPDPVERR